MKKKVFLILLAIVSALCLIVGLTACDDDKNPATDGTEQTSPGGIQGGSQSGTQGGTQSGTHTHQFSSSWSSNDVTHWHAATCGHSEKRDESAHNYVNGVCTTCYYAHENHSYGIYTSNESGHSRTCSICQKAETGSHTYVNGVCTTCNYTHVNHSFGSYTADDSEHTQTCTVCQKAETGSHTYQNGVCATCNHAHENHVYGEWVVTQEASCTQTGLHYHDCFCGQRESETIPTKDHQYTDCVCDFCGAMDPDAVTVDLYIDNQLQNTLYTDAEMGYKILLPEVSNQYSAYFDGWYANTEYMEPLTGEETYHTSSAIYARWIPVLNYEIKVDKGEATIVKCYNTSATAVVVPAIHQKIYPITGIGANAFKGMTTIRWLIILSPMRTIGTGAFNGCNSMKKVVLPDSLTSIGNQAFYNCSSIEKLEIPDSVTSIGDSAFFNCSGLTGELKIPDGVTSIERQAFYNCSGLTGELKIPDSVTSIGNWAFSGCSGLTGVTIGSGVTSIGWSAFKNCSNFESVIWNAEDCTYAGSYSYSYNYTIFNNCMNLKTVTFGENVKTIPDYTFYGCSGLESVIWNAENCTYAGSYSTNSNNTIFQLCTNLNNVTFGDNVKTIPAYTFYDCSGLTCELKIPNGVTSIGEYAFNRIRDTAKNQKNILKRSLSRA